jgi:hypothetical protein
MKKLKMSGSSPVSLLAGLSVGIVSLLGANSVFAQYTAVIGGSAQSGATYVSFDSATPGSATSITSGGLTVTFAGNAETVEGPQGTTSTDNNGAPPILSGNNNVHFGSAYTGYDNTPFIDAGNNPNSGKITMNFSSAQNYLGLLWGSVDANNTLTFYSGANGSGSVVETITGADLVAENSAVASGGTDYGDTFNPWGTAYVNVNTSATFESVVATTDTFTFEIENLAYGDFGGSSIPDGGLTVALLGGSMLVLGALRRRLARA